MSRTVRTMELRNVPRHRVLEYLEQAGGTLTGELSATGEAWSARLEAMEPVQITVMTIRRDQLIIEGAADAVNEVYAYMRQKTMRGGG